MEGWRLQIPLCRIMVASQWISVSLRLEVAGPFERTSVAALTLFRLLHMTVGMMGRRLVLEARLLRIQPGSFSWRLETGLS